MRLPRWGCARAEEIPDAMKITDITPAEGYEKVVKCEDPESGLKAVIAVHDTTLGRR